MPEAFRSCIGVLSLEKTFGLDRLVEAYACDSLMRIYGYQDLFGILNRGDDADFLPQADEDYTGSHRTLGTSNITHR